MGSFIGARSISINLNDPLDIRDRNRCKHFSLREYVSSKRNTDWRKSWTFPTNMSNEESSFPPMNVKKFKLWSCQNCLNETNAEATDNIVSAIQQAPIPDDNLVRRGVDLNLPIDISSDDDDDLPIEFETGLENNLNSQVPFIPSPEVSPHIEQEVQTEKEDVEPPATTLINENPINHLPQDTTVCSDAVPTNNADNVVQEDVMDPHLSKSTNFSDKEHQKKSLVSENLEQGLNQPTEVHESVSLPPTNMVADEQTPPVLSDKVDVEEDMHAKERGRESDEVNDVEPLAIATVVPDDNRGVLNLNTEHPEGHPPLDSNVPGDGTVPTGNPEDIAKNDILDDNPTDSIRLSWIRPLKMRSLADLLSRSDLLVREENVSEPQPPTDVPTNPDSLPNLPADSVDVEEATTSRKRGRGRKKKSPSNKKSKKPARNENEVENLEGDANAIDTIPHNELEELNSTEQTKKWLSLQEVTSNPHLLLKDSETNISGPSMHNADVNRGKGKGKEILIEENNRAEKRAETVGATMTENSNQGATDDIPMDVVEFMAKMQYEKTLPDEGNATNLLDKPNQKESENITREENVLPENNGNSINFEKKGKKKKKKNMNGNEKNSNANINLEKPPKNIGVGTLKRKNAKKIKDPSNQSTTAFNVVAAAEMLQSAFDSSHSTKKLKIEPSKSDKNSNAKINLEKSAENIDPGTSKRKNVKKIKDTSNQSTTAFNVVAAAEMLQSAFDSSHSTEKPKNESSKSGKNSNANINLEKPAENIHPGTLERQNVKKIKDTNNQSTTAFNVVGAAETLQSAFDSSHSTEKLKNESSKSGKNSNANINLEKPGENIDPGISKRKNVKRMNDTSNQSATPFNVVATAQMLQSAFDSSHSTEKLKNESSKSGKNSNDNINLEKPAENIHPGTSERKNVKKIKDTNNQSTTAFNVVGTAKMLQSAFDSSHSTEKLKNESSKSGKNSNVNINLEKPAENIDPGTSERKNVKRISDTSNQSTTAFNVVAAAEMLQSGFDSSHSTEKSKNESSKSGKNSNANINLKKPAENIDPGISKRKNVKRMNDTSNQSATPFNVVATAQMLQSAFDSSHSTEKLKIGQSKSGENFNANINLEKLAENIDVGTSKRENAKIRKDTYNQTTATFNVVDAAEILQRAFDSSHSSENLKIHLSKSGENSNANINLEKLAKNIDAGTSKIENAKIMKDTYNQTTTTFNVVDAAEMLQSAFDSSHSSENLKIHISKSGENSNANINLEKLAENIDAGTSKRENEKIMKDTYNQTTTTFNVVDAAEMLQSPFDSSHSSENLKIHLSKSGENSNANINLEKLAENIDVGTSKRENAKKMKDTSNQSTTTFNVVAEAETLQRALDPSYSSEKLMIGSSKSDENSNSNINLEKAAENIGVGTLKRKNAKIIKDANNQSTTTFNAIAEAEMLQRALDPTYGSKKLMIGSSKSDENSNSNINLEKPTENIGAGTSKRKNAKIMKDTSNQSTTTFNAIVEAEMLQSALDPSQSSKKLKIGSSKSDGNSNPNINVEKSAENIGVGTSKRKNTKRMKDTSNQSITTFNAIAEAEMLQSALDPSHSSKKLKIGSSKSDGNSNSNIKLEKPAENIGVETSKRKYARKMKDKSNQSTIPFDPIAEAEMLIRALDPSGSSKRIEDTDNQSSMAFDAFIADEMLDPSKDTKKLLKKSGKNAKKKKEKGESSKSSKKKEASDDSPWWFNRKINLKDMANRMSNFQRTQETSGPLGTSYEKIGMFNSNPVDLNVSEERTAPKNNGEDMILEDNVAEERNDLPAPGGNDSKKNLEGDKK
ncbi:PREDICTED: uncharacterized protein DDB_G0283357-like isoform X2 [Lupinus angustifolius]|uniref:uncharacterized protein DDB_G0283357-like isoform X2 n=1 Tax=Lupinus angustifolius TaxID=3871 RepID=UPI00092E9C7D|nr:PREDICTED: uncharacterized protein DDB_G0283357-like isoform X2 [Lupinus angustifolius]